MQAKRLTGLGVAMTTPFSEDFSIDFTSLQRHTEHLINGGVDYLVIMGTTGENPTINIDDQFEIFKRVKEYSEGRVPMVFGVGGNATQLVIDKVEKFNDYADAYLVVSPYYNKPNEEGIIQHYKNISEATNLPIILYNVPGRTASNLSVKLQLRLAEIENVIGVKEASGNVEQIMELARLAPEDFKIISGDDALTFPLIPLGVDGVISVIGNAYTKQMKQIVLMAKEEKIEAARYLHFKLLPMINALFADGNPGGIKVLLNEMGLMKNILRAPLFHVNEKTDRLIRDLHKVIS
ncbi:MAG: 4-hydroxy-tetrahydrodipicolinate synthase [Bacteroidetes bacterium MED-G17]|jgi:4-hydroxy-tetrahydrodipicolinate synthase|nr:MAG: 4-hydroxy-tetrahydrodipicolinate synthase [Bacteroidetes bacterium TMED39]CAI8347384.1 MAG: 4-hydroxy-tetrahydrodipicolinate synthase [Bacteroidetes bacterium MED-G17]|tara:strand:+ start:3834 stop:4712 length:879 start_codon:yes stop_codon:yes gene_type:complete